MNQRRQLSTAQAFTAHDAGCAACVLPSIAAVRSRWQWLRHGVDFQPECGAKESELAKRAKRYLPMLLGCERQAA